VTNYTITVRTADAAGAGTDADIEFRMIGTIGQTNWINLDEAGDSFERNDVNMFIFELPDVGTPNQVQFRTREESASPDGPAWKLLRVCVYPGAIPTEILTLLIIGIGNEDYKRRLFENALAAHPSTKRFSLDNWIIPASFSLRGTANEWTVSTISAD
jgi:hypothetical protein